MPDEQAFRFRELSEKFHIGVSIHAPYFISFASADPEVVQRSRERMRKAFALAQKLGSSRVIFHPGYSPGDTASDREAGLRRVIDNLMSLEDELPTDSVSVFPETGGKRKQLGSLQEIITICTEVPYARPCIDFAHLHARDGGSVFTVDDVIGVFDQLKSALGPEALDGLHCHYYPVDYDHNGERKHKAFSDRKEADLPLWSSTDHDPDPSLYYPQAEPFAQALRSYSVNPVVICEAMNTQDIGALLLKGLYFSGASSRRED